MSEVITQAFYPFDGGFSERLEPGYVGKRDTVFEHTVALTDAHFWDPHDTDYIDFQIPFDLNAAAIIPFETVPELCCAATSHFTPRQKIEFANDSLHWWLSGFLYGEQGALSLSLDLCGLLGSPGAVEYAANQAREEARHIAAFSAYIRARWGAPLPVSPAFRELLCSIVHAEKIHRKIIGMQVLVEGLAMGFMASLYHKATDPVLVRLAQLVMADETFHHKAGRLWAKRDFPALSDGDRQDAEEWALKCFESLMFNVFNPSQKHLLYTKHGLDPEQVRLHLREYYTDDVRRKEMSEQTGVLRIVVKALFQSGVVTERTRARYMQWVDVNELRSTTGKEAEEMIAEAGLTFLETVNARGSRRRVMKAGRAEHRS